MQSMQKPPENAAILFDGVDLNNWWGRDREPAAWDVRNGVVTVAPGSGDIVTKETYTDALIHVEFRTPDMPEATGQAKGNSGVYLQGRYEIQVLDSYGVAIPGKGDCGALYDQHAPLVNACRPPLEWQSYDVIFRGARMDEGGEVMEAARVTVLQNDMVIHNNVELLGPTGGALDENVGEPGALLLQNHGNLLQYRNIWLVHLPLRGSDSY